MRALVVIEKDSVADAGSVRAARYLECHQLAVGRDDGVGGLPSLVIIEVGQADEVFAGAIEFQLVDIDVLGAVDVVVVGNLAVALDGRVLAVGEDAFALVVGAGSFGEIGDDAGREIDAHDAGHTVRLVAGEGHLLVVVVEVLRLDVAAFAAAFIDLLLIDEFWYGAGEIDLSNHEARVMLGELGVVGARLRVGDEHAVLGDGCALMHVDAEFDGFGAGFGAEVPELVVAEAAGADVYEFLGADEDVVAV